VVKLALLTAAAKLFFSRPPEAQKLLGAALAAGLNDADQDVHDRALLYYRCVWLWVMCAAHGVVLGCAAECPLWCAATRGHGAAHGCTASPTDAGAAVAAVQAAAARCGCSAVSHCWRRL
jgi:hypothetical protein